MHIFGDNSDLCTSVCARMREFKFDLFSAAIVAQHGVFSSPYVIPVVHQLGRRLLRSYVTP